MLFTLEKNLFCFLFSGAEPRFFVHGETILRLEYLPAPEAETSANFVTVYFLFQATVTVLEPFFFLFFLFFFLCHTGR